MSSIIIESPSVTVLPSGKCGNAKHM